MTTTAAMRVRPNPTSGPAKKAPTDRGSSLDAREQKVYDFIRSHVNDYGAPPSVREIGEACGLVSPSTVAYVLRELESKGFLRREPSRDRKSQVTPAESQAAMENSILELLETLDPPATGALDTWARKQLHRRQPSTLSDGETQLLMLLAREAAWAARSRAVDGGGREKLVALMAAARERAGRPPLEKMAKHLGYSAASSVSRMLTGKVRPTPRTLEQLGDLLDVPADIVSKEWVPLLQSWATGPKPAAATTPVRLPSHGPGDGCSAYSPGRPAAQRASRPMNRGAFR